MRGGRSGYRACPVEQLENNSVKKGDVICKGFVRIAEAETPEQQLWLAVLCQAVMDLMMGVRNTRDDSIRVERSRNEAFSWFRSGRHVFICDMVGLNPDFVMDILREHAGLE